MVLLREGGLGVPSPPPAFESGGSAFSFRPAGSFLLGGIDSSSRPHGRERGVPPLNFSILFEVHILLARPALLATVGAQLNIGSARSGT